MKVVFLDFDGVITTPDSHYKPMREKVELVRRVLDATDSVIVLSSSWRPYWKEDYTQEGIIQRIRVNPYYDISVETLFPYIIGCTSRISNSIRQNRVNPRGYEIESYLNEHPEIESYVIIDDDNIDSVSPDMSSQIVYTNHFDGITEEDADRAIEILNK